MAGNYLGRLPACSTPSLGTSLPLPVRRQEAHRHLREKFGVIENDIDQKDASNREPGGEADDQHP